MTIKQQGGIFGRNPTFNDLTVEGSVSVPAGSVSGDAINGGTATPTSLAVNTTTALDRIHAYDASQTTDQLATQILLQNETGQAATAGVGFQVSAFGEGPTGTYAPKAGILFERNAANGGGILKFYNDGSGDTTGFALGDLRMEILNSGNISVTNGNLVMATSGTGIDFSATAGTGTSELFSDYEEGEFTPTWTGLTTSGTETTNAGFYTKVGRMVYYSTFLQYSTSFDTTQGTTHHTLPFTPFKSGANFASNESNAANVYTGTGLIFSGSSLSYVPTVSAGNTMIVFSGTYMAV